MIPPHPDSDGRTIAGRYQLREVLGRGGMGTVWLADDLLLRREVALKELLFPETLTADRQEELRQRSLREAQAAARISSPHAVRVYDVVTQGGQPWIVMERHHGRTLSEIVAVDGPRSPMETARIGLALLAALDNAHKAGIVHRDVKPSNVLVRDDGHVTLTDFGIARGIEDTTITRTGMIVGSPAYVAPERATGAPALPPSDLWALGATLFTAVEGHPPYDRGDPMLTLAAVMYDEPEPCRAAGPLSPAIHALLAKDPAQRPTIPAARALLNAAATSGDAGTATLPVPGSVHMGDRTVLLASGPTTGPAAGPPADTAGSPELPPRAAARQRPPLRSGAPGLPIRRQRRRGTRSGAVLVVLALLGVATALLAATRDRPAGGDAARGRLGPSTPAAGPSPRAVTSNAAARPGSQSPNGAGSRATPSVSPPRSTADDKDSDDKDSDDDADDTSPARSGAHVDPQVGWSIDKPPQWRVRQRGSITDLVDPDSGRYLRIDSTDEPKSSARGAWEELETSFARRHDDYNRLRLETITWRGFDDVADWEYSYRDDGVRLRGIDRGIVTGGRAYALNFQARESQWTASQPLLRTLFASFQPAPAVRQ